MNAANKFHRSASQSALAWSVRLMPAGALLIAGLHRAEAQGFADAWNRIEASDENRAQAVPDDCAPPRAC